MASQTVLLFVARDTASQPAPSFIGVVKCPAGLVNIYEGYTALLVAREAFCALMTTVTRALISYSVNIMRLQTVIIMYSFGPDVPTMAVCANFCIFFSNMLFCNPNYRAKIGAHLSAMAVSTGRFSFTSSHLLMGPNPREIVRRGNKIPLAKIAMA